LVLQQEEEVGLDLVKQQLNKEEGETQVLRQSKQLKKKTEKLTL
jgi:hypothetical protein